MAKKTTKKKKAAQKRAASKATGVREGALREAKVGLDGARAKVRAAGGLAGDAGNKKTDKKATAGQTPILVRAVLERCLVKAKAEQLGLKGLELGAVERRRLVTLVKTEEVVELTIEKVATRAKVVGCNALVKADELKFDGTNYTPAQIGELAGLVQSEAEVEIQIQRIQGVLFEADAEGPDLFKGDKDIEVAAEVGPPVGATDKD